MGFQPRDEGVATQGMRSVFIFFFGGHLFITFYLILPAYFDIKKRQAPKCPTTFRG